MKVIILAAGLGSRLNPLGDQLPKPLTKLMNGESILHYQLRIIQQFIPLEQVTLVVGYQKEAILERFPYLSYVYNEDYAKENTSKSLLKAISNLEEDVIWLNGDVIFRPSVMEQVVHSKQTAMVVNQTLVGEEEMKYRVDSQQRIIELSKHVQNPQGEALGINFFTAEDLPYLKMRLKQCQAQDYFEKGIERLIVEDHRSVQALSVGIKDCAEIDFPEDLIKANQLFMQWLSNP